nr:MAG TPA: hypothetical protein [Caudoviricetes sp.]
MFIVFFSSVVAPKIAVPASVRLLFCYEITDHFLQTPFS